MKHLPTVAADSPAYLDELEAIAADAALSENRWVRDEPLLLPRESPDRWLQGAHFRATMTSRHGAAVTPAPDALLPHSVELRRGDEALVPHRDFELDARWSAVGGALVAELVSADYGYGLLRVDSIARDSKGGLQLVRGISALTTPVPPPVPDGTLPVANVFVPYSSSDAPKLVLPIVPHAAEPAPAPARPTPRFAAAARGRGEVRITFWGDSVTAGGDVEPEGADFPALTTRRLSQHLTGCRVQSEVVAHAGSTSSDWLSGENHDCDWQRIADSRPDILVVEFVNDAGLPEARWAELYEDVLRRAAALEADVLLTTPHWTMPEWMRGIDETGDDARPYVRFLRRFASERNLPLADVSAGWGRLRSQGLPFVTLLQNGINHPDHRGHALAATIISDALRGSLEFPR